MVDLEVLPEFLVDVSLPLQQVMALAEQDLQAGKQSTAETLCRAILRAQSDYAPALHLLGIISYQVGDLQMAIDFIHRATLADQTVALYHCNLGEMFRLAGQRDAALGAGRRALEINPNMAHAHNNVGIVHYERNEFDDAIAHYRRAIALSPDYAEAYSNLGNALRAQKAYEGALIAYQQALHLRPNYADAINNMGAALRDVGRLAEAEATYRQALSLKPNNSSILNNLALVVRDLERFDEASKLLSHSLSVDPKNSTTLTYLALVKLEQKQISEAEVAAEDALTLAPNDPEALNAMGIVRFEQDNSVAALALHRQAVKLKPDLAPAHNNIGNILKENGQLSEARAAYQRAIELEPREVRYYVNLADSKKFTADDPYLAAMESLARNPEALRDTERYQLYFALAKAYDDLSRYDDAFLFMSKGNALKRGQTNYNEAHTLGIFDRISRSFDGTLLRSNPDGGYHSSLPVFIVGMPRSGTTLIEQILASHPAVYGAGELLDFNRLVDRMLSANGNAFCYPESSSTLPADQLHDFGKAYVESLQLRAPGAKRITDKMPANFLFLGLIHLALPHARIIHVSRDPRDTCLSCYSKLFATEQNFTYDLGELGRYYRKYVELMAHWRQVIPEGQVLEVRYEDVIADLETSARRIVDHCGLDWHPNCIAFHEAQRPVRTASASQVRSPIYRTSEGRWRAYEAHLSPLLDALGDSTAEKV